METITLSEKKEIADAMALQIALERVSSRVSECVEKKLLPPDKCFCLYNREVELFKNKLEIALKNTPQ